MQVRIPKRYLNKHLLMFGETHGTKEMPDMVGEFLDQALEGGRQVVLGLEYPQDYQDTLDRFATTQDPTELFNTPHFQRGHDGRSSEAMVKLLQKASKMGLPVRAFDLSTDQYLSLDPDGDYRETSQQRDFLMGQNILSLAKEFPSETLVVTLAGNVHSKSLKDDSYVSAGEVVRAQNIDMASIKLVPESGNAWCMVGNEEGKPRNAGANFEPVNSSALFQDQARDGYDAVITIPSVEASLPAVFSAKKSPH